MTDVPASLSLRNRLVLTLIIGAALLTLVLFYAVRSYATQIAQSGQDSILNAAATSILDAAVLRDGRVDIDIPYAAFSMLSTPSDDRVFYAIYQDDALLSGYDDILIEPLSDNRPRSVQSLQYKDQTIRVVTLRRTLIGATERTEISVILAQSQDALAGTLQRISRNVALLGAGFFVLTTALSFWATSTTIGQLNTLTSSVTRRGPQDLRPFTKATPVEMTPLVASLNSLMGRLDSSLKQSEDFIAEAAHRLRTPLATVRSHAEATLQRVDKEENRQALRAMVRAIDESSRAANQLLDHAMITFRADHLDMQEINLVELVDDLVGRLTPVADMKDVDLAFTHDGTLTYLGDPILLQSAVRNVIDNALKYTPAESTIQIHLASTPRPHLTCKDQGPGFPTNDTDILLARFKRGENAKDTIGSGLGLTIAADVVAAHDGEIQLKNDPKGGACVTFLF